MTEFQRWKERSAKRFAQQKKRELASARRQSAIDAARMARVERGEVKLSLLEKYLWLWPIALVAIGWLLEDCS